MSKLVVRLVVLVSLIAATAHAGIYAGSLKTSVTVQATYTKVLTGSMEGSGSLFSAMVSVKHPAQASLKPRLWIEGTAVALSAYSGSDCPSGDLCWVYVTSEQRGNPIDAKLELKSTSGSPIAITPSSTQKVNLQMYSCSTIPFAGGC